MPSDFRRFDGQLFLHFSTINGIIVYWAHKTHRFHPLVDDEEKRNIFNSIFPRCSKKREPNHGDEFKMCLMYYEEMKSYKSIAARSLDDSYWYLFHMH